MNWFSTDAQRDESAPSPNTLPVYQLRYTWFLLPAVLFLALAMILSDGQRLPTLQRSANGVLGKAPATLLALVAVMLVSAADPSPAESLLRQGDDAFARQDFDGAITFYEKAESLVEDPGRVSFNKAAAYYRLGRYKEAIEGYRRTLEDDQAPPDRRARACYDLGNALTQYADGDARQLEEAVAAYRAALRFADAKAPWRSDVRHNLELAQLLLLQASAKLPDKAIPKKPPEKNEGKSNDKDPKKQRTVLVPVDPTKGYKPEKADDASQGGQKSKSLQHGGHVEVLPDRDKVVPLSPESTLTTLEAEARRIAEARRKDRHPPGPPRLLNKDW